eukprot:TRINITY_DN3013_c0_g2_i2.p1 TRINITY_DN3013_c0_g2~~TRINITY_DN3013_c0_g2_i2.p1  ORF type:complete len:346 (+),score=29.54 TRINITY_DN3013_c0_g2_i2:86-1123(+)
MEDNTSYHDNDVAGDHHHRGFAVTLPLSSLSQTMGLVLMVVCMPVCIGVVCMVYQKRNEQMFKQRFYPLVLIEHIGAIILGVLMTLDMFTFPLLECQVDLWTSLLIFPLSCLPILMRGGIYCFRFWLTQERNLMSAPRLMNYLYLISSKFILRFWSFCILSCLAIISILSIIWSTSPMAGIMYELCPWNDAVFYADIVLSVVTLLLWLVTVIFLWKAHDFYKIKEEMVFELVLWVGTFIVYAMASTGIIPSAHYFSSAFYIVLGIVIHFIFQIWLLYLTSLDYKINGDMDFMTCMRSKYFFDKFKEFLVYQLCVENILFWHDVQEFRKNPSLNAALRIEEQCIFF